MNYQMQTEDQNSDYIDEFNFNDDLQFSDDYRKFETLISENRHLLSDKDIRRLRETKRDLRRSMGNICSDIYFIEHLINDSKKINRS